jgi:hypothetical protein
VAEGCAGAAELGVSAAGPGEARVGADATRGAGGRAAGAASWRSPKKPIVATAAATPTATSTGRIGKRLPAGTAVPPSAIARRATDKAARHFGQRT